MGCNVGFAKTYQNQIFGIKINETIATKKIPNTYFKKKTKLKNFEYLL